MNIEFRPRIVRQTVGIRILYTMGIDRVVLHLVGGSFVLVVIVVSSLVLLGVILGLAAGLGEFVWNVAREFGKVFEPAAKASLSPVFVTQVLLGSSSFDTTCAVPKAIRIVKTILWRICKDIFRVIRSSCVVSCRISRALRARPRTCHELWYFFLSYV